MIECVNENIWYKRKGKKTKRRKKFLILVFFLVVLYIFYSLFIVQNVGEICYSKCQSVATEGINKAIIKFSDNTLYNKIINIEKNTSGDIVLIETNSNSVNSLSSRISLETKEIINNRLNDGIEIPFFAFTGIKSLSGYGKNIKYKALEVINVESSFENCFESVGINQTLHSVFLNVYTKIKVFMPLKNTIVETCSNVLLCETVVIGKIPDVYLQK